jgi:hypothetical protein
VGPQRGCSDALFPLSSGIALKTSSPSADGYLAATVNQYLAAGLIDELRTHIAPVTLGGGARLFDGVPPLHLELLAVRAASLTTHISYRIPH